MCGFTILKDNYTEGCTEENIRTGRKLKGSFITCYPNYRITRQPNPLAKYVILYVPWMDDEDGLEYCKQWLFELDYEVLNHNVSLDGYRIRTWGTNISNSEHEVNYGRITRPMVENYLNKWNGIVQSANSNQVIFDVGIYEIAISENFWGDSVNSSRFSQNYDSGTGIHEITFDFTGYNQNKVEECVKQRGGEVLYVVGNNITFNMARDTVLQLFKNLVKMKIEKTLWKNRYRLTESAVDTIIANSSLYTMDESTFNSNLIDLLVD